MKITATLKLLYILLIGTGVFFIPHQEWLYLGAIFGIHLLLWPVLGLPLRGLRFLWKVKWFVFLILLTQSCSFTTGELALLQIKSFTLFITYDGLLIGSGMVLKLLSMLLVTQLVRGTMSTDQFVKGLKGLGIPTSMGSLIEAVLGQVTGDKAASNGPGSGTGGGGGGGGRGKGSGGGHGGGRHRRNKEEGANVSARQVLSGKIGNIPDRVSQKIKQAKAQFAGSPHGVLGALTLAVTLVRLVKIAPGFPLAPGHKNILLVPLFLYGNERSGATMAGTRMGLLSGILHFIMGFGKWGPLGIVQFVLFGLVIDVSNRIPIRHKVIRYTLVGGLAGLTRVSSEMLLAWVFGLSGSFYLLFLPYVVSQVAFGMGSGLISAALLRKATSNKEENATE